MQIDLYAHLDSPIHRWEPRTKLVTLLAVMFVFSAVRVLWLVPPMVAATALLYALARLPLRFLVSRLRYPGYFLGIMAIFLPFFTGETGLVTLGPVVVYEEGLRALLLVVSRFGCILTVGLVLFGTAPFVETIKAMRRLGLPSILADMMLLSFRYLFEIAGTLTQMETAMRLRGFRARRFSLRGLQTLAALAGSILIRSFEQSERVYKAMRLRGYGRNGQQAAAQTDSPAWDGPALVVDDLRFSYPDRSGVLQGASFSLARGERVGLIGPNGAGKTSLFLLLSGVLQPEGGSIALDGEPVQYGTFRPEIGLVFQDANDQLFSPTVRDDVAFGPENMGLSPDEVEVRVSEALATVGAEALADRPPHHLSGGEKRMAAIASVLAMHPTLMLYDEPDASLDVQARRRLIRFLQNAPQTVLLASHDLELILEVCDRVLLLDAGRVVADGEPRAVMGDAVLMEMHGLEKPHSLIPHEHVGAPAH